MGSDKLHIFHFNSRSLCWERYHGISAAGASVDFNSRSLRGERFKTSQITGPEREFQFTLPAWGAMDLYFHVYTNLEISIHAPRMGSDMMVALLLSI